MKKILKAGTYYIGDPCYIFDGSWMDILNQTDYLNDCSKPLFDRDFFAHSTAFGDGEFYDNNHYSYSVDAGLIACLPIEFVEIDNKVIGDEEIQQYGNIVIFPEDFVCSYNNGIFNFGDKIIINTSYESDDDYSEYDCDFE